MINISKHFTKHNHDSFEYIFILHKEYFPYQYNTDVFCGTSVKNAKVTIYFVILLKWK